MQDIVVGQFTFELYLKNEAQWRNTEANGFMSINRSEHLHTGETWALEAVVRQEADGFSVQRSAFSWREEAR